MCKIWPHKWELEVQVEWVCLQVDLEECLQDLGECQQDFKCQQGLALELEQVSPHLPN